MSLGGEHPGISQTPNPGAEIETVRLRLRRWKHQDRAAFAALNRDETVMRFIGKPLTRTQSDASIDRYEAHFDRHGYGKWAVQLRDNDVLIGAIGLEQVHFDAPFCPGIEIGWRLGSAYWGKGYAQEGAAAVLEHAFTTLGVSEIVAFTAPDNVRSRRLMERLGMTRDPDGDFSDTRPGLDYRDLRYVLYRISNPHTPEAE